MDLIEKYIPSSNNPISILTTNNKNPKLCIIETHGGIEGNKNDVADGSRNLLKYCLQNHTSYITYDLSNNGTQKDQPLNQVLFSTRVSSLNDVISFVRSDYNCPILLIGSSLGGLITINAASQNSKNIIGIVINCGVIYPEETIKRVAGENEYNAWQTNGTINILGINLPFSFLKDIQKLKTAEKLKSLKIPILWFHGDKDEMAPIDQIRIASSANTTIRLIEIENGKHRFGINMQPGQWEKEVETFIQRLLSL